MTAIDAEEQEREAEARQEHEQLREEIRNKNLEEINVLRITLDTQIETLEGLFENAHYGYLQHTDQRTTEFKNLTRKDQELSKEIEQKIRKIDRLQSSLQTWKMKISQNKKECQQRNASLSEEKVRKMGGGGWTTGGIEEIVSPLRSSHQRRIY
jgi:dynein regulatory complex subunit 2